MAFKVIDENLTGVEQAELMTKGIIQISEHSYAPMFIVNPTDKIDGISKVLSYSTEISVDGEEVQVASELATLEDSWWTNEIDGIVYLWMGADKNNGKQMTYSTSVSLDMQSQWCELLGEENMISFQEYKEIERRALMYSDLDSAKKQAAIDINMFFDELSLRGFDSDCLGEIKHFDSDAKSVQQIMGQFSTALGRQLQKMLNPDSTFKSLRWKESGITVCYEWTDEQIIALATSLQEATQELEHARELVIDVVENCNTIDEVKEALENLK